MATQLCSERSGQAGILHCSETTRKLEIDSPPDQTEFLYQGE